MAAAGRVIGPRHWFSVDQRLSEWAGIAEEDADLAVLDPTSGAGLPTDPDRVGAFFDEASVVNHQHPAWITQCRQGRLLGELTARFASRRRQKAVDKDAGYGRHLHAPEHPSGYQMKRGALRTAPRRVRPQRAVGHLPALTSFLISPNLAIRVRDSPMLSATASAAASARRPTAASTSTGAPSSSEARNAACSAASESCSSHDTSSTPNPAMPGTGCWPSGKFPSSPFARAITVSF